MVKDMQYILEWVQKNGIDAGVITQDISIQQLKYVGGHMGNYNDQHIALILLSNYLMQETNVTARREALLVQHRWEQQKNRQKNKLIQLLRTKFNSI